MLDIKGEFMLKKINLLIIILLICFSFGCKQEDAKPTRSSSTFVIAPGDIIVASASRSLVQLDSNGNFKQVLYTLPNNAESIYGISWKSDTKEIIFTINGLARVGAISAVNGAYRNLITDANLSGLLKGLTQLNNGDILVAEVSNVERFSTTGVRKTLVDGVVWPNTLGASSTTLEQLWSTANGGFIACSSGSDNVKRYTDKAVIVGPIVVSGIAATTDGMGCAELPNGNIATVWSGTTDSVRVVSAAMASAATIYSDLAFLAAPRAMGVRQNGNILIADSGFNQIVEITSEGTFVRTLGEGAVGVPSAVFSVPNY